MKETFFLEIGSGESDNLQKLILKCIMFLEKQKKKKLQCACFENFENITTRLTHKPFSQCRSPNQRINAILDVNLREDSSRYEPQLTPLLRPCLRTAPPDRSKPFGSISVSHYPRHE